MKEFRRAEKVGKEEGGGEESEPPRGEAETAHDEMFWGQQDKNSVEALKLEGTHGGSPGTLNLFFLVQGVNIYSTVATIEIKNRRR